MDGGRASEELRPNWIRIEGDEARARAHQQSPGFCALRRGTGGRQRARGHPCGRKCRQERPEDLRSLLSPPFPLPASGERAGSHWGCWEKGVGTGGVGGPRASAPRWRGSSTGLGRGLEQRCGLWGLPARSSLPLGPDGPGQAHPAGTQPDPQPGVPQDG